MATKTPAGPPSEDMDVRKPSVRVARAARAPSRRSLVAVVELLGGLSNASAESMHTLSSALTPEAVATDGLTNSILAGLRDGNARFFEELSNTSKHVFDALRAPRKEGAEEVFAGDVAEQIDYDRLAGLVAAQMKKPDSSSPTTTTTTTG
jgi:hypothetical protein